MVDKLKDIANLIKESKYLVVFTGAGMDTESDVPDFRGEDGIWKKVDPSLVASIDSLYKDYSLFHEFYKSGMKMLDDYKPHKGHLILADWEKEGILKSVATQNISGLHKLAGNKKIAELHGNAVTYRCDGCNEPASQVEFLEKSKCKKCGDKHLRPNITLFGEMLPEKDWDMAEREIRKSDLLIVIGTSLEVSPVNQLPNIAGGKTLYINDENKQRVHEFDFVIKGKVGKVLEDLDKFI